METLLAFNDDAALVGARDGNVRTVLRSPEQTPDEWERHLRDIYDEPGHWYPDDPGVPVSTLTGYYSYESNNQGRLGTLEGTQPYEAFTNESGLVVRAAFLAHNNQWVVGDRQPDFALDGTA